MLENYFDFLAPDDIRLKGSRIGIETVLYEYIHRAQSPEAIQQMFPSLMLEQIYAAILYYLRNKPRMDIYMTDWLEFGRQAREQQRQNPFPAVARLRQMKDEIEASSLTIEQYLKQRQADREAKKERLGAAA
jgi:uncharacterized protein (DUF433 family)